MFDMMASMANKPGGIDDSEAFGMKNMMEMFKEVQNNPELKRQMEGYWKMLDNMSESDPD
jgi:hypothetical protein